MDVPNTKSEHQILDMHKSAYKIMCLVTYQESYFYKAVAYVTKFFEIHLNSIQMIRNSLKYSLMIRNEF